MYFNLKYFSRPSTPSILTNGCNSIDSRAFPSRIFAAYDENSFSACCKNSSASHNNKNSFAAQNEKESFTTQNDKHSFAAQSKTLFCRIQQTLFCRQAFFATQNNKHSFAAQLICRPSHLPPIVKKHSFAAWIICRPLMKSHTILYYWKCDVLVVYWAPKSWQKNVSLPFGTA